MLKMKHQLFRDLMRGLAIHVTKHQLKSVDNRQREVVYNTLLASSLRIAAQEQYAESSTRNAARKRLLLERMERLVGERPMWMGTDLGDPAGDQTTVHELDYLMAVPQETIRATEEELRLAAGSATCGHVEPIGDPMDWPLPCDVDIGACTIRRGVSLRVLATRVRVLHVMAKQAFPGAADMTLNPAGANAELDKTLV